MGRVYIVQSMLQGYGLEDAEVEDGLEIAAPCHRVSNGRAYIVSGSGRSFPRDVFPLDLPYTGGKLPRCRGVSEMRNAILQVS